jgi:hypothetical protein
MEQALNLEMLSVGKHSNLQHPAKFTALEALMQEG